MMNLQALLEDPAVAAARRRIRELDGATLERQVELAQIPAPPFGEEQRGGVVRERFAAAGLQSVTRDPVGNVLGWLPDGAATPPRPDGAVVISAHLDTVFPPETDLSVRHAGDRIHVPGIADNARGLAALLTLAEVLRDAAWRPRQPLVFVATVGEEGAGDLRGVKHLFREGSAFRDARAFLSLDGSGLRRIVHRAVGSKRLRVRIDGAGGHSWSDWGMANPLHVLGSAIHAARSIPLPGEPRTTLTVARAGGGTSINAIPASAWLELDLRSEDGAALRELERQVRERFDETVATENRGRRRNTPRLRLEWEPIGDRPGGIVPASAPLVRAAVEATEAIGAQPELVSSSTDANVPISLGVPALTLGAGGESGGIHTTDEWYSNQGGPLGIERALLVALAAAG